MMEPARSRAVFSNEDFRLLRTAVVHYARTSMDPEGPKYANLLHRLGRVAPSLRETQNADVEAAQAG